MVSTNTIITARNAAVGTIMMRMSITIIMGKNVPADADMIMEKDITTRTRCL